MAVRRDYTGGAIVSAVLREQPENSIVAAGGVYRRKTHYGYRAGIEVVELFQTDERFEEVVRLAHRVTQVPEFSFLGSTNKLHLVVDNTDGSGRITELIWGFRGLDAMSIILTAEREQRSDGGQYFIPRRGVVTDLVDAFQEGRIEVSEELTLSGMLESELTNLTVRTADEASALVVAVALLTWKAREILPYRESFDHDPPPDYDDLRFGLK
jgi:hypothetical protein